MLKQGLHQKLLLKLSPQQIQLMKLLQVPTMQLEQRIKEELEANPALEEGEGEEEEEATPTEDDAAEIPQSDSAEAESDTDPEPVEEIIKAEDDVDMSEYYDEDDEGVADYKTSDPSEFADPDDENKTIPVTVASSFHEYLEGQVGMMDLDERQQQIAMHLIGSLDDDGYLRRELDAIADDLVFRQNISTDEQELLVILGKIQKLDPPGVGARTLEECLLLQLQRKEDPTVFTEIAIRIVEKHFDLFAKKHYDKLEHIFDMDSAKLKRVLDEIVKLNPKPGSAFSTNQGGMQLTIIPDFLLTNTNGELVVTLNSANAPELRISNHFKEMISTYKNSKEKTKSQKDAILFIKQKIDSAKWFIDAIQSRYHTMMMVMNTILDLQYDYLGSGDETQMKPMILKDIAERTGLDISTVSRVANSKYVQTEFGTIPLKFFFSEALSTDSGEEVSSREVKKILSDLIGAESKKKPISDQNLTKVLNERGYNIARRTVAKYREQLNIPVARLRKEL
ncbi:MAG TPA: RNA polymerase factor sigma-54, partial [Chitinophagales bacterium]|nr:RNA polymerase factor sigma-54 [Chitinophagales bacterium]